MPIQMPRGLPFSVDTWTPNSNRKRHHFLTHAHKDHLAGIAAHSSHPIYSTSITKSLLLPQFLQVHDSLFVVIEVGESVLIRDPDGDFTVTAFDANHCPGAVMFLFEGEFGNVLHTGDCRLSPDCLQNLPLKYITKNGKETLDCLDYLFLDCTFGRCSLHIPSKQSAIQQVIKCIWKHPNAPVVYLACDLLGQEEILVEVSRTFGSKIYVDKIANADCFQALRLIAPEIISEDSSSRFQVFEGYPRLYERASVILAEAHARLQPEPLFIRPSSQWYACDESSETQRPTRLDLSEALRDEFGVWHACYSMHSSREELESALQFLQPKWVISTTPPCRAMELDYVKKHCFKTKISSDDPIWKLLKVGSKVSISSVTFEVARPIGNTIPVLGMPTNPADGSKIELKTQSINSLELQLDTAPGERSVTLPTSTKLQLKTLSINSLELQLESSPRERPVTLFGRARLGLQDHNILREIKRSEPMTVDSKAEQASSLQEEAVSSQDMHSKDITGQASCTKEDSVKELHIAKCSGGETEVSRDASCTESSKNFYASSSLFRSMNVSVPSLQGEAVPSQVVHSNDNVGKALCLQEDTVKELHIAKYTSSEVKRDGSCIGSSKSFNASLRKFYRSMNVPVPMPLPSLTELMDVSKRPKLRS